MRGSQIGLQRLFGFSRYVKAIEMRIESNVQIAACDRAAMIYQLPAFRAYEFECRPLSDSGIRKSGAFRISYTMLVKELWWNH